MGEHEELFKGILNLINQYKDKQTLQVTMDNIEVSYFTNEIINIVERYLNKKEQEEPVVAHINYEKAMEDLIDRQTLTTALLNEEKEKNTELMRALINVCLNMGR